jgi:hypothetical protein
MKSCLIEILALVVIPFGLSAQQLNQKTTDSKNGQEILIGYCDRSGLQQGDFGDFLKYGYDSYKPEKSVTFKLISRLAKADIVVVLGTWCSDSREQVPRFFKILDKAHFKEDHLKLICVDSSKEAGSIDISQYDIKKVPTFIFRKDGKEIGRIIETPMLTLEKDMLLILGK